MAATRKKKPDESKEPSFEDVLGRLESLVKKLEEGELPLEQSLSAYEEGVGLVRSAQGRLNDMEGRLEKLMADGSQAPMASEQKSAPTNDDELPF